MLLFPCRDKDSLNVMLLFYILYVIFLFFRKNTRFEQKGKKNGHVDNHASYLVVAFENRKKA